ncbi:MAG: GHKL domain-containing protein [Natronincolaceae bacterium]|nr:GHKL domain-containing protein [Bacillota bacterium]NLK90572.1 GHKL domain-containing protein [Clostridiales bacterium]
MQWYEGLILAILQVLSIFLVLVKLSKGINLISMKSVYAALISLALIMVFFKYEIDIGFLVNFIVLYIVLILLFKLPIRETIVQFLITVIIVATIELMFAYVLFLITGFKDVSFNGLFAVDLAVVMTCLLINRFVEFDKVRQRILQYKNYIATAVVSITGVILLFMYIWRTKEDFTREYTLNILMIIVILEVLNAVFLYQSIRIKQQEKVINVHKRDIPFLKNMMHEIRQKQHDFKNHLNVLYIIVQTENDGQARERIKEYIEKLTDSIKPADELLDIGDQVLGAIIYSKKVLAEEKNICFEVEFEGEIPEYPIERYELVELLGNLLDNAIEAAEGGSDDNSKVILTLGTEGGHRIIEVKNTGKAIRQGDIDKVFRRGFSTKKGKCRGYGLYNIKKIVNDHNGTIGLSSDNCHTVFRISF